MTEEIRFTVEEKEYFIKPVDAKVISDAQKAYNKAFREAVQDGCLLKKKLDSYMREQGLWDEAKDNEYKQLVKDIAEVEYYLNRGNAKLSEAREKALKLKDMRFRLRELISERGEMDTKTAEGQAENHRFNYLVYLSTYDFLTRKRVYSSFDDYLAKIGEELATVAASKFANYLYGLDENYESTLTENKFLKRFKFVDDEGYLINREGKRVDSEGNLLDKDGYRIDENGQRIDINNNPILETTVDDVEFIDDLS